MSRLPHFRHPPSCRSGRCQAGGWICLLSGAWRPRRLIQCNKPFTKRGLELLASSMVLFLFCDINNPLSSDSFSIKKHVRDSIWAHSFINPQPLCFHGFHTKTSTKCHQVPSISKKSARAMYRSGDMSYMMSVYGSGWFTETEVLRGLWSGTGRCSLGDPS